MQFNINNINTTQPAAALDVANWRRKNTPLSVGHSLALPPHKVVYNEGQVAAALLGASERLPLGAQMSFYFLRALY